MEDFPGHVGSKLIRRGMSENTRNQSWREALMISRALLFLLALLAFAHCGKKPTTIVPVASYSEEGGTIVMDRDDRSKIHVVVIIEGGHHTFSGPDSKEEAIEMGKNLCIHYQGRMFQLAFKPRFVPEANEFIYGGGAETYLPDGTLAYAKE